MAKIKKPKALEIELKINLIAFSFKIKLTY